jgi:hypothetical protein
MSATESTVYYHTPDNLRAFHNAGDLPLCEHGYLVGSANGKEFKCNNAHNAGAIGSPATKFAGPERRSSHPQPFNGRNRRVAPTAGVDALGTVRPDPVQAAGMSGPGPDPQPSSEWYGQNRRHGQPAGGFRGPERRQYGAHGVDTRRGQPEGGFQGNERRQSAGGFRA